MEGEFEKLYLAHLAGIMKEKQHIFERQRYFYDTATCFSMLSEHSILLKDKFLLNWSVLAQTMQIIRVFDYSFSRSLTIFDPIRACSWFLSKTH